MGNLEAAKEQGLDCTGPQYHNIDIVLTMYEKLSHVLYLY